MTADLIVVTVILIATLIRSMLRKIRYDLVALSALFLQREPLPGSAILR